MKSLIKLSLALLLATHSLADDSDHINFENSDTLHGTFKGITSSGKIIWLNSNAENNIAFLTKNVRKIVINDGKLTHPFTHTSYVTLTNNDTIPGDITAINSKTVTLKTDYAGVINIAKNKIKSINFTPHGYNIFYRGPFSAEGWKVNDFDVNGYRADDPFDSSPQKTKPKKDKKKTQSWEFNSFSWINKSFPGSIIYQKDLPEVYRFTYSSYSSSSHPYIVLCADGIPPKLKPKKDDKQVYRNTSDLLTSKLGRCLIIRPNITSANLTFFDYSDTGKAKTTNIENTLTHSGSYRTSISGKINFDLRVDRPNNTILFYSGDNLVAKWDISTISDKLKGNKFGFATIYRQRKASTVTDFVVSSWNGIVDPAITLENDDRDITLLNNGTDRFSGNVLKTQNGKLEIKGPYADLAIPLDQISTIHFAKKHLVKLPERAANDVTVRFYGTGRLTGTLSRAKDGGLILDSVALGKLPLKQEFITSIEFVDMEYAYELN